MYNFLIIIHRDEFIIRQFEVHHTNKTIAEMIAISYIEYNEMEAEFDIYTIP